MPSGLDDIVAVLLAGLTAVLTGPLGPVDLPPGRIEAHLAPPGRTEAVVVRDRNGADLGILPHGAGRVPLETFPESFILAVLAAEDRRFTDHAGVDPVGLGAAVLDQLSGGRRGGSTLTQQLVKNAVTGGERSLPRKLAEASIARRLEQVMRKSDLLEAYLAQVPFGRGPRGAAHAAEAWFGKAWSEVTLAEAALLAALLKGPAAYDPERHPERAKARRDAILDALEGLGWIGRDDHAAARAEPIRVVPSVTQDLPGWPERLARRGLGSSGESEVALTIDLQLQGMAEAALRRGLEAQGIAPAVGRLEDPRARSDAGLRAAAAALVARPAGTVRLVLLEPQGKGWLALVDDGRLRREAVNLSGDGAGRLQPGDVVLATGTAPELTLRSLPVLQGAVVLLDPRDGAILASVGGYDARLTALDRTLAQRQPGSAAKPFVYLAALEIGIGPKALLDNVPRTFGTGPVPWIPQNYEGRSSGPVSMERAFTESLNIPTVALAEALGIEASAELAEASGAWRPGGFRRDLPSAIGASETSLLALTAGYAALVNDGMPRAPRLRLDAPVPPVDRPIATRHGLEALLDMMAGVVRRGTAREAFRAHPVRVAGKTGTSQEHRDAWFIAVTPHLALGVWVGRDDGRSAAQAITGGRVAAPIAAEILREMFKAGRIDAEGYRDGTRSAGLDWGGPASAPRPAGRPEGGFVLELTPEAPPASARTPWDPAWPDGRPAPLPYPPGQGGSFSDVDRNADLRGLY